MQRVFDRGIIGQVQQATDIVDVVSEHVALTKKGKEMVGLCPFHDDHRPSLYVNPDKQIFKCFACGAGGSVFTFVQMRENLSFPQAVERLAQRAGIKLRPQRLKKDEAKDKVDPNRLAKINDWAATHFQKNLFRTRQGKAALAYLTWRKINGESIKKWRLGLALDTGRDLLQAAEKIGLDKQLLEQAGLIVGSKSAAVADKFVNRLMFPIRDVTGRVIGFGGRTLSGDAAKYINSPGTPLFNKSNCLYGLCNARHQIVATGTAVVVEGYTDCIMAHQFGHTNVVATLGTSLTAGHARLLRRYAKQIVLVFDSDTAGIEAANRALQVCLAQPVGIRIASIPGSKDPCDFLLSAGPEQFHRMVEQATNVFEFKWNRLKQSMVGEDSIAEQKAAVEEFLQIIATGMQAGNLSAIEKGLIVNRLSKIIGLTTGQIEAELSKRIRRLASGLARPDGQSEVTAAEPSQGYYALAQRELLEVLLNEPALYETVKEQIGLDVFEVPVYRQIAQMLFEALTEQPDRPLDAVLARIDSVEVGRIVAELAEVGEQKGNYQRRLDGAIQAVRRYRSQQAKKQIKNIEDQRMFLKRYADNTDKENPHTVGMR